MYMADCYHLPPHLQHAETGGLDLQQPTRQPWYAYRGRKPLTSRERRATPIVQNDTFLNTILGYLQFLL